MSLLGLSTSYYADKGLSIYDSVLKIIDLGFTTVEFGAAHMFEAGVWETLRKIRQEFPGLNCLIHALFPPQEKKFWFNPAEGLTELNRVIIDNLFTSAEILNAMQISIHAAIINEFTLSTKEITYFDKPIIGKLRDREQCKKNFFTLMEYIDIKSSETGIRVLIENTISSLVTPYPCTVDEFSYVFNRFPNTGLLLDVGHALISGELHKLIDLQDYIQELHLHDSGDILKRGYIGHLAIKNMDFFVQIKKLLSKPIPMIFEHGADIPEEEILEEKLLLESFMEMNKDKVIQGIKNER